MTGSCCSSRLRLCGVSQSRKRPNPILWVFVVICLALPVLAHGCHGDDVDHEPAATRHEPEQTR